MFLTKFWCFALVAINICIAEDVKPQNNNESLFQIYSRRLSEMLSTSEAVNQEVYEKFTKHIRQQLPDKSYSKSCLGEVQGDNYTKLTQNRSYFRKQKQFYWDKANELNEKVKNGEVNLSGERYSLILGRSLYNYEADIESTLDRYMKNTRRNIHFCKEKSTEAQ